jgi:hypothetical protein
MFLLWVVAAVEAIMVEVAVPEDFYFLKKLMYQQQRA